MSFVDDDDPLISRRPDDGPAGSSDEPAPGFDEPGGDEPGGTAVTVPDERSEPRSSPAYEPPSRSTEESGGRRTRPRSPNMLPGRRERSEPERLLVRLIATGGIVAIGVAIAAIMRSSGSAGWIIGLVVSIVSVVLAAVLWSVRTL